MFPASSRPAHLLTFILTFGRVGHVSITSKWFSSALQGGESRGDPEEVDIELAGFLHRVFRRGLT